MLKLIAPDQNRTDTHSLEGYCSTVELQALIYLNTSLYFERINNKNFYDQLLQVLSHKFFLFLTTFKV
jgi:hypothetical protein